MALAMMGSSNSWGDGTEGDRGNRESEDYFFHGFIT